MNGRRWVGMLAVGIILAMAAPESVGAGEVLWQVRAVHPQGRFLEVKALDRSGEGYDVVAIEEAGNLHVMDVKAFVGGGRMAVKILVSEDAFAPVKAILQDGTILDVKALTADGTRLDVKGVSRSGNIIHIKAIGPDGEFYGVKAISRKGQLHDVKGVKMSKEDTEAVISGVPVHAHIEALPQVPGTET